MYQYHASMLIKILNFKYHFSYTLIYLSGIH